MIGKKWRYAMLAGLITGTLVPAVQAADSNGLVYEDATEITGEVRPEALAAQDGADGALIRVVRRGNPTETVLSTSEQPIKVDADSMYYGDTSGNVIAVGKVDMVQGNREIHSDRIVGNVKTQDYTTDGPFHYLEDKGATKDLTGENLSFNTGTNAGSAPNVMGFTAPYFIKGEHVTFDGDMAIIKNGWVTTKHAMAYKGVPDYRMEGSLIEVYPGDKAIIHNARLFIKNGEVLSRSRYVVSLRGDRKSKVNIFSLIPRPMYDSTDGFGFKGNIEYPIGAADEAFFRYEWYTKGGFKPSIGYRHFLPWGTAQLAYSRESATLNAQQVWVEKRPELSVDTHVYHIGDTPFTIRGGASIGYWKEDYIKGTHRKLYAEVSHDTWHPWKDMDVRVYGGYQKDHYGYNDYTRNAPYWGVSASQRVTDWLTLFGGYKQYNIPQFKDSPYPFDTIDVHRNAVLGFTVRLSRLDSFTVSTQRDVQSGELRYVDYTWYRDMHSFEGWLTYQSKQKEWKYMVVAKDF